MELEEFNKFISQFEQMKKMMKGLGALKGGSGGINPYAMGKNFPFK
jgi:signal recognition particle GTPase